MEVESMRPMSISLVLDEFSSMSLSCYWFRHRTRNFQVAVRTRNRTLRWNSWKGH